MPPSILFGQSDVIAAQRAFGSTVVFTSWLRFRRDAADAWHADWQDHPKPEMVRLLDGCARFAARLN